MTTVISNAVVLETANADKPVLAYNVAGDTNAKQLAAAICEQYLDDSRPVSLHAMGHNAVGQAVKSVTIANSRLSSKGILLVMLPTLVDREIDVGDGGPKQTRTVTQIRLIPWQIGG